VNRWDRAVNCSATAAHGPARGWDTAAPMTLLVALKGDNGLALAADSRGTFGDPRGVTAQNDSQQKAHILAPHVAVLQAGAGEVGAMIVQEVAQDLQQRSLDGATEVMNVLRDTTRARYDGPFPRFRRRTWR
jgi:ATP-dependent protease HslVU (ClpYQ) peptidase subunit